MRRRAPRVRERNETGRRHGRDTAEPPARPGGLHGLDNDTRNAYLGRGDAESVAGTEAEGLGNVALRSALGRSGRHHVQRDVYRDGSPDETLLDRFNRDADMGQQIGGWIYSNRAAKSEFLPPMDDLFDAVVRALNANPNLKADITDENRSVALSDISFRVSQAIAAGNLLPDLRSPESSHLTWLFDEAHEYTKKGANELLQLVSHTDAGKNPMFAHFGHFDTKMIWRFSSQPSTELVYVERGTPYSEVVRIIAAHSGGNEKSDPRVSTLSFGRNIGALMGTALSAGGDKHVTNIIDKAAYLIGIDVSTLGPLGISAHPALGRAISLFETEYVLVNSPGNPTRTLKELATVVYDNPFKGGQVKMLKTAGANIRSFPAIEKEMGTVQAEVLQNVATMPPKAVKQVEAYARAASKAATVFASMVQSKDQIHPNEIGLYRSRVLQYINAIRKLTK